MKIYILIKFSSSFHFSCSKYFLSPDHCSRLIQSFVSYGEKALRLIFMVCAGIWFVFQLRVVCRLGLLNRSPSPDLSASLPCVKSPCVHACAVSPVYPMFVSSWSHLTLVIGRLYNKPGKLALPNRVTLFSFLKDGSAVWWRVLPLPRAGLRAWVPPLEVHSGPDGASPTRCSASRGAGRLSGVAAGGETCFMFIVQRRPHWYGDVWGLKRKSAPGGGCVWSWRDSWYLRSGSWGLAGALCRCAQYSEFGLYWRRGEPWEGDILKFTFLKGCVGCRYIGRTSWGGAREEGEDGHSCLGRKMLAFDTRGRVEWWGVIAPGSVSKVELSTPDSRIGCPIVSGRRRSGKNLGFSGLRHSENGVGQLFRQAWLLRARLAFLSLGRSKGVDKWGRWVLDALSLRRVLDGRGRAARRRCKPSVQGTCFGGEVLLGDVRLCRVVRFPSLTWTRTWVVFIG